MKYQIAPMWFSTFFEKDSALRTRRLHRCRRVLLNRSIRCVPASPLPTRRWRSEGTTAAYGSQKSV